MIFHLYDLAALEAPPAAGASFEALARDIARLDSGHGTVGRLQDFIALRRRSNADGQAALAG